MWSFVSKRFLLLGAALITVPTLAFLATPRQERAVDLFVIERSKNRNVVRYDLVLDKSGFYDTRRPLDVYWLMLAEDGRREELSILERRAYGFELLPNAKPNELGVRLARTPISDLARLPISRSPCEIKLVAPLSAACPRPARAISSCGSRAGPRRSERCTACARSGALSASA
jgi:hypothetical protein